ncbi:MAG: hypothetical protein DRI46_13010 [Chloroflexi bacterium]|nr:MAG: hypothetical protein DRI46_13010 [Chloroflexota bacterium]
MGLLDDLLNKPSYEEQMAQYKMQMQQYEENKVRAQQNEVMDAISPYAKIARGSMADPVLQNQSDLQQAMAGTLSGHKRGIESYLASMKGRGDVQRANQKHQYKQDNPLRESANKKLQYANIYAGRDVNDTTPLTSDDQRVAFDRANRAPTWLNQRTQFQEPGSGQTVPINIAEEQVQEKVGQGIGDRLVDYEKTIAKKEMRMIELDNYVNSLNYLEENVGPWTTGYGAALQFAPTGPARDWKNELDSVNAKAVVDTMSQLKALSSTGSTGFGAVNIQELMVMMNKWGKIDEFASDTQIKRQVKIRKNIMGKIKKRLVRAMTEEKAWRKRNNSHMPNEPATSRNLNDADDQQKSAFEAWKQNRGTK